MKKDSNNSAEVAEFLEHLCEELVQRLKKEMTFFKTVSIIAITNKLETHTKSFTLQDYSQDLEKIQETSRILVREFFKEFPESVLRRAGVRVSSLASEEEVKQQKSQKTLFEF